VEIGNILEMVPSNGSDIVQQINERMARVRFWPWVLGGGLLFAALLAAQPNAQPFALALIIFTAALSVFLAHIDIQRKTVVILYDLSEDALRPLKAFSEEFDKLASAAKIWIIDTLARTDDWKRQCRRGSPNFQNTHCTRL
jgi:hypothetical protein